MSRNGKRRWISFVNSDGSNLGTLKKFENDKIYYLSLCNNNEKIIFVSEEQGDVGMYELDIKTKEHTRVLQNFD